MTPDGLPSVQNAARSSLNAEEAARGGLVKIGPVKRLLILGLEILFFPPVRGLAILGRLASTKHQEEIRKILVLEYWNLGDIVILLPFLQNLRTSFPKARISLMVNPSVLPLLEGQELVDELIPVRVPWAQHFLRWKKYNPFSPLWINLARTLLRARRQRFDLALTGRMDIRDNLLVWLIGARRRVGYGVGGGGLFLTDVVTPDLRNPHRSQVWLRLLEYLEKPIADILPRLWLGEDERGFGARFLEENGIRENEFVLGVHPGARIPTRQWGDTNFAAVAARLSSRFPLKILWFRDPKQGEVPKSSLVPCISVALPFRHFMAVLARCHLLVCNDSGPMHIASALGVPVVAVFGPTKAEWFGPMGDENRVVIRPEFWCRPCFDSCIFDQPYCLRTVSTDQVVEATLSAINDVSLAAKQKMSNDTNRLSPAVLRRS